MRALPFPTQLLLCNMNMRPPPSSGTKVNSVQIRPKERKKKKAHRIKLRDTRMFFLGLKVFFFNNTVKNIQYQITAVPHFPEQPQNNGVEYNIRKT